MAARFPQSPPTRIVCSCDTQDDGHLLAAHIEGVQNQPILGFNRVADTLANHRHCGRRIELRTAQQAWDHHDASLEKSIFFDL